MAEEQQKELETPTPPDDQEVTTVEAVEETPETAEAAATAEAPLEPAANEAPSSEATETDAEPPEAASDDAVATDAVEGPEDAVDETLEAAEAAASEEETATAAADAEEATPIVEAVPEEIASEETAAEAASPEAEAEASSPEEEAETASPEVVQEAVAAPQQYGYTGEITGRVVKLEDLDTIRDEEEGELQYAQLKLLIEETLTAVSEHEIVKGRVVSVGEKDVVIDIGFKSDGVVPKNEFAHELQPDDEVEVYLERIEDYHGQLVLSKTKADKFRRWERVEQAYEKETVLEGTIVRRIKGGMIVDLIDGLEAFLPGSQIDVRPVRDFDAYLDKKMEFKIVKINPANENVVVSHKALIEKELESQRETILATMEPGQILEGTVKNITDFGVFIDLGGVDGLLHITDLSWGRVSHPSELVDLDEKLKVVVLDYDKERQRISLGLKQLQPHPWENISEKYKEADVVEGKVVSITDYGAFVELEKGIEGLVHISEMSWTDHIRHPSQKVSLGQLVNVVILNIDHQGKKISLGMKQLEKNPWDGLSERYPPGTVLRGKVRNITNFGVFVEIEPGIDGLVHISDLSWTKKIRHPGEIVKKGQELDVVILDVDEGRQRVSLGHKQIETNPWNDFATVYADGTDHAAKISRVEDKGVVVDLTLGVEGFVPAGELKRGQQNFRNLYHEGEELDLRVIRFDQNQKEIVLSETVKEKQEARAEREREQREKREERLREDRTLDDYAKRAKAATGPTTLGELSGLEDLKAQMVVAEQEAQRKADEAHTEAPATGEADTPEAVTDTAEAVAEEAADAAVEAEAEVVAEDTAAEEAVAEAIPDEAVAREEVEEEAEAATAEAAVDEEPAEEEAAAEESAVAEAEVAEEEVAEEEE